MLWLDQLRIFFDAINSGGVKSAYDDPETTWNLLLSQIIALISEFISFCWEMFKNTYIISTGGFLMVDCFIFIMAVKKFRETQANNV